MLYLDYTLIIIISYSKLSGNYNNKKPQVYMKKIISYSKLSGNYNVGITIVRKVIIISYSKLSGNYNLANEWKNTSKLYHILNCQGTITLHH